MMEIGRGAKGQGTENILIKIKVFMMDSGKVNINLNKI